MKLGKKVIIAGTRSFDDYKLLKREVTRFIRNFKLKTPEIVSGMAKGADTLGMQYAKEHMLWIKEFPADWVTNGNAAGPMRNKRMAEYATHCIVFWDGYSPGTANMIKNAKYYELPLRVVNYVSGTIENYGEEKSTG